MKTRAFPLQCAAFCGIEMKRPKRRANVTLGLTETRLLEETRMAVKALITSQPDSAICFVRGA